MKFSALPFLCLIGACHGKVVLSNMFPDLVAAATDGSTVVQKDSVVLASDFPSMTPSDLPSDMPSDFPSVMPSAAPTGFGHGAKGLFTYYCDGFSVAGSSVVLDFTYRLRVRATLVDESIDGLQPVSEDVETALQGAVADALCGDSAVVAVDSQPADFPIDTCGRSCFVMSGQMLLKTSDESRADELRCTAMEIIYGQLSSPDLMGVNSDIRSYQWESDVNDMCASVPTIIYDIPMQAASMAATPGAIAGIVAAAVVVVIVGFFVGRRLYRSRNAQDVDDEEHSLEVENAAPGN